MANDAIYGFTRLLPSQLSQTAYEFGLETLNDMVREHFEEYTRQFNATLNYLARPVTSASVKHMLPSSVMGQDIDIDGNPLTVQMGVEYEVGWPIRHMGHAYGLDRVNSKQLTVDDVIALTQQSDIADKTWLTRWLFAALFTNVSYTYSHRGMPDVTVQPLANGDSIIYPRKGMTAPATDNHYYAQAAAISTTSPYSTIYNELYEHPSNRGPFIAFIATNLVEDTRALPNFFPAADRQIIHGADISLNRIAADPTAQPVNSPMARIGDEYLGYMDNGLHIVHMSSLPTGYGFAVAEGASDKPLAMRQYPQSALQGLLPEIHNVDGNHIISRVIRHAGFGALNRVAAMVFRVGNGTYAIPDGYNASTGAIKSA